MATSNFFYKDEFIKWLSNPINSSLKRPGQLAGYIGSILDNVLEPLGCGVLIEDIGLAFQYTYSYKKVFESLDTIYTFLKKLVWISNNIQNNTKIAQYISQLGPNKIGLNLNSINSWPNVIKKYEEFLQYLLDNNIIKPSSSPKHKYLLNKPNGWNEALKRLKQEAIDNLSIKGTDSIISLFSGEADFIHYILKDSYFFTPKLAASRFKTIANIIKQKKEPLFARKSNGLFKYTSEINNNDEKSILVTKDSTGNKAVQELIENNTGYTVSGGYNSIFLYYTISHIWGNASDPRYFTNIWNIAIVPTWANFLLDKEGSKDELTKKVINTFRAICIEHYKMREMNWASIDKIIDGLEPNSSFVVNNKTYTINVICEKTKTQDFGKISQVDITI